MASLNLNAVNHTYIHRARAVALFQEGDFSFAAQKLSPTLSQKFVGQSKFTYDERWTNRQIYPSWRKDSVHSSTSEEIDTVWQYTHPMQFALDVNFPDFLVTAPGIWLSVEFDFAVQTHPTKFLTESGWSFSVDLSEVLDSVASTAVKWRCDGEYSRYVQAFVGVVKKSMDKKLLILRVNGGIDQSQLVTGACFFAEFTMTLLAVGYGMTRLRLGAPGSDRSELESE